MKSTIPLRDAVRAGPTPNPDQVEPATYDEVRARFPGFEPMLSLPSGTAGHWYRAWLLGRGTNGQIRRVFAEPSYVADEAARKLLAVVP